MGDFVLEGEDHRDPAVGEQAAPLRHSLLAANTLGTVKVKV